MSCAACTKNIAGGGDLRFQNTGADIVANSVIQAAKLNTTNNNKNNAAIEIIVNKTIEAARNQPNTITEQTAAKNVAQVTLAAVAAVNSGINKHVDNKRINNIGAAATISRKNMNMSGDTFNILVRLIEELNLKETLLGFNDVTFFAPNDNAFKEVMSKGMNIKLNKLNKNRIDRIISDTVDDPGQKDMLEKVILYHVVKGRINQNKNKNKTNFKTVSGDDLKIMRDGNRIIVHGVNTRLVAIPGFPESMTIYSIDQVLMPPLIDENTRSRNIPETVTSSVYG